MAQLGDLKVGRPEGCIGHDRDLKQGLVLLKVSNRCLENLECQTISTVPTWVGGCGAGDTIIRPFGLELQKSLVAQCRGEVGEWEGEWESYTRGYGGLE